MGTNWGTGSSVWTWGRTSSLWGWRSPGPGCPGMLWNLLLWRYSSPTWTRSCAACCRWPCSGRRAGLDDPQRSLPTPELFCDSVILWFCEHLCQPRWLLRRFPAMSQPPAKWSMSLKPVTTGNLLLQVTCYCSFLLLQPPRGPARPRGSKPSKMGWCLRTGFPDHHTRGSHHRNRELVPQS